MLWSQSSCLHIGSTSTTPKLAEADPAISLPSCLPPSQLWPGPATVELLRTTSGIWANWKYDEQRWYADSVADEGSGTTGPSQQFPAALLALYRYSGISCTARVKEQERQSICQKGWSVFHQAFFSKNWRKANILMNLLDTVCWCRKPLMCTHTYVTALHFWMCLCQAYFVYAR